MTLEFSKKADRPSCIMIAGFVGLLTQTANVSAQELSDQTIDLDTIVVTATKTDQDPIDIPFGLTYRDRYQLEDKRAVTVHDIVEDVANIELSSMSDGRAEQIKIRGVGPLGMPANVEDTSVVVYLDGVPLPNVGGAAFDLERAEVLKGPQGTLFGRNTTAGAINLTSATPTSEKEFSLSAEYGEDGHQQVQAIASGPLVEDKISARVAMQFKNIDGYISNELNADDIGRDENYFGRATLLFTPSEETEIKLVASAEKDERTFTLTTLRNHGNYPHVALDLPNENNKEAYSLGLNASHEFENFTLTSVTGYNHVTYDIYSDSADSVILTPLLFTRLGGLVPQSILNAQLNMAGSNFSDWEEEHTTFSQEFRVNSNEEASVNWVGGLAYYHSNFEFNYLDRNNVGAFGNFLFPALNGRRVGEQTTNSYSVFGEAKTSIGESGFNVTGGLRLTHERKENKLEFTGVPGIPGIVASATKNQKKTFNFATGRVSLGYDFSEQTKSFATISHGYKSGGYQRFSYNIALPAGQDDAFDSTKIWSYEIGVKHRSDDSKLNLAASVFFNDIKNEQVLNLNSTTQSFQVAGVDARTWGAEIEGSYFLTDSFEIGGNIGYTHSEMRNASKDFSLITEGGKNGNTLPNIPSWTGGVSVSYRQDAAWIGSQSQLFANMSWQYMGAREADAANSFKLAAHNMINAKAGIDFNEHATLYAFGENLLDEHKEQFGSNIGGPTVAPGRGRVIGLGLKLNW